MVKWAILGYTIANEIMLLSVLACALIRMLAKPPAQQKICFPTRESLLLLLLLPNSTAAAADATLRRTLTATSNRLQ